MRTCENCDHLMVCAEVKDRLNRLKEDRNVNNIAACNHWSGWHDLKEDPEDLPTKEENEYLVAWRRAPYMDIYYEVGSWEFIEGYGYGFHYSHSECIIAWREIEPFEEEE